MQRALSPIYLLQAIMNRASSHTARYVEIGIIRDMTGGAAAVKPEEFG